MPDSARTGDSDVTKLGQATIVAVTNPSPDKQMGVSTFAKRTAGSQNLIDGGCCDVVKLKHHRQWLRSAIPWDLTFISLFLMEYVAH